jgi:hypothetical protein
MRNRRGCRPALATAAMVLSSLGLIGPVEANDSSAVLGAGGLVLTRSDSVVLEAEDLYVSLDEIRVHYRFRNVGTTDVETVVAFPMPEIDLWELAEVPIDLPVDDPLNFVGFEVQVDGKRRLPLVEQRAFVGATEVSEDLRLHGIPFTFFDPGFSDALAGLSWKAREELVARDVLLYGDDGTPYAKWRTRTTFHWTQLFPAGEAIEIEHRYHPVAGQFFITPMDLEARRAGGSDVADPYCIDAGFDRALDRRLKQRGGPESGAVLVAWGIDYILTTAANWAGPIGEFRLTVDKGDTGRLVSFCGDGVAKTGPTTFTLERRDFVPTADLHVLLVE